MTAEMLEGTRHRRQRFKGRRGTEYEQGNQRARLCVIANATGRHPEHGDDCDTPINIISA